MSRPKLSVERRVSTAIRIPESMHEELRRLAGDRDVSVNYLIVKAVRDLLARMSPADQDLRR